METKTMSWPALVCVTVSVLFVVKGASPLASADINTKHSGLYNATVNLNLKQSGLQNSTVRMRIVKAEQKIKLKRTFPLSLTNLLHKRTTPHNVGKRSAWNRNTTKTQNEATRRRPQSHYVQARGANDVAPSVRCLADRLAVRRAVLSGRPWAQTMTDSSGRLDTDLVERELDVVGVREECLSVEVPPLFGFQPQYCVVVFELPQVYRPPALRHLHLSALAAGVCFPDTCTQQDVASALHDDLAHEGSGVRSGSRSWSRSGSRSWTMSGSGSGSGRVSLSPAEFNVDHVFCQRQEKSVLNAGTAATLTFVGLWCVLLLSATFLHGWCGRRTWTERARQRRRRAVRVHYQPHVEHQEEQQQALQPPSRAALPDTRAVHIDIDIDSDVAPLVSRPRTHNFRSVPRSQPGTGPHSRHIRGILRRNGSLRQSALDSRHQELSSLRRLALCFSLDMNVKKLLNTSKSDTDIGCLHGIRVLSFCWVVLVNCVMYQNLFARDAFNVAQTWRKHSLLYSFIGNGDLALDSLFTLSGLLVGYAYSMRLDQQTGKMNWAMYVLHRYWRVISTLTAVGVAYLGLFPYLISGPLSPGPAPDQTTCLERGWMNVLLVQNFSPSVCMNWTWYLAVDFQLFLLTPFLLLLLYHRRRLAYVVVFVVVLLSWIVGGVLTKVYDLPVSQWVLPTSASGQRNVKDFASLHLYMPWTHAGAFFPPLILGYLLHRSRQRAILRLRTVIGGWGVALAVSLLLLLAPHRELVGERAFTTEFLALYNAVQPTVWSLSVCWVVLACSTGHGGPLNTVLSGYVWRPLSRLVFVAYLVHPIISTCYAFSLEQLSYTTRAVVVYYYLGVLVSSLLMSAVVTVTVEMPLTAVFSWAVSCAVSAARNGRRSNKT